MDIIHLNTQLSRDFMGLFVAKALDIPCVVHLRSFKSTRINKYKVEYLNNINARYIAISNQIKKHWINKGLSLHNFEIIYNVFYVHNIDIFTL